MASPVALTLFAVDLGRTGPSLRRPENDHRPDRTFAKAFAARIRLYFLYVGDRGIKRRGHLLMHSPGLLSFDEVGLVPVTFEQFSKFIVRDTGKEAGISDFV